MDITKTSGENESFNEKKLCGSIRAAGAPEDVVSNICNLVEKDLRPGDTTTKIFRVALNYLIKDNVSIAARYSLRRGVASLGPAGFIFEQYVEAILQAYGYETSRNVIMKGKCVSHEVDILAQKDNEHYFVETKYHNVHGIKTHVDVVMYAKARLDDLRFSQEKKEHNDTTHNMWLITNTKFTTNSITYAKCEGLRLTGWNYPRNEENLERLIENKKLYPVTVLPSVKGALRESFAQNGMILAQDLLPYTTKDMKEKFGIGGSLAERLTREVKAIAE